MVRACTQTARDVGLSPAQFTLFSLKSAVDGTCLPSLTNNNPNGMNISQNSARMKCYLHHKQSHFSDYFDDSVLDDSVIYVSHVPFQ